MDANASRMHSKHRETAETLLGTGNPDVARRPPVSRCERLYRHFAIASCTTKRASSLERRYKCLYKSSCTLTKTLEPQVYPQFAPVFSGARKEIFSPPEFRHNVWSLVTFTDPDDAVLVPVLAGLYPGSGGQSIVTSH
eukprot:132499-Rhodomonas_salina.2